MLDEWNIEVNKIRKGDRILYDDEWRTVTESHQYLGPGWNTGEEHPAWVMRLAIPDTRWDYQTYPVYGMQDNDDYDGPEKVWPLDCTEEIEFGSWDDLILMNSDRIEILDSSLTPIRWWVAVYEEDQGYGGPEEGGWWFDIGEVKQVVPCSSYEQAENMRELLRTEWKDEGRPTYSVLYSGGNYRISIEKNYPKDYPQRVPHYS